MVSQGIEDYLESIYLLGDEEPVGTKELAKELGVEPPSVSEMLQKLEEKNYIEYKKYSGATLTKRGKKIAQKISDTHRSIKELFKKLGVSEEKAELDACKVEHELSDETFMALNNLLKYIKEEEDFSDLLKEQKK